MSKPFRAACWSSLSIAMILGHPFVLAADTAAADQPEAPAVREPVETVDTAHQRVSETVEVWAKRLDSFFGDERAFEEANDTRVMISVDAIGNEHGGLEFGSKVRAKVRLPTSEQRLHLVLESDPRGLDSDRSDDDPANALDRSSEVIFGLERQIDAGQWELRPSVGVKVDWPLDPYARMRAIRYFDLGTWTSRVSSTAAWFNSDGISVSGNVDFDRRITPDMLFRSSTSALWEEEPSLTSASQMFTVYQRLASTRAILAYDLGASFDDAPDWDASNYFARVRYRRLIYKNWAYMEVQPAISWPEEINYRKELSLLLRLEVNFGRAYRLGAANPSE
jgi:hypothetical protein